MISIFLLCTSTWVIIEHNTKAPNKKLQHLNIDYDEKHDINVFCQTWQTIISVSRRSKVNEVDSWLYPQCPRSITSWNNPGFRLFIVWKRNFKTFRGKLKSKTRCLKSFKEVVFQHKHNYKQPFAKIRQHIFFSFQPFIIKLHNGQKKWFIPADWQIFSIGNCTY